MLHYNSYVIYKNIILFKKDRRGRRSLQVLVLFLKLMPVGEHSICSRKKRADMESAPTGLMVVLKFVCRKGLAPHALPNAILPKAFPCEGRGTACGG